MSRVYVLLILTFVAVIILGVGCRTFSENVKDEVSAEKPRPSLSSEDASNSNGESFDDDIGKIAEKEYNAGKASEKLARENSNPQSVKNLFEKAEEHYFNALKEMPSKALYVEAWGRIALKSLSAEQCVEKLSPLVKKQPGAQQLVIIYARLLFRLKKYQLAIDALQECFEINMDSQMLCREIMMIYLRSGNVSQGKEYFEWMEKNGLVSPSEVIIYGTWWSDARNALARNARDRLPKDFSYTKEQCDEIVHGAALKLYSMGTNLYSESDLSLICSIGLFLAGASEKELHAAFVESKAAIPEIRRTIAFVLMVAETSEMLKEKDKAMEAALALEESKKQLQDKVLARLMDVFKKLKEPSHAARVLEEIVLRQGKQSAETLDELMMLYLGAREYDNVILTAQLYGKPTDYSRYALGFAYKEKGNYRAAYREFKAAEKKNASVNGFWLYMQLAIVCQNLKNADQALLYAEKAWKMKPEEAMLCNFYGYMLADNGVKLEFAQELIEKALKEDAKNVAYLDSLAWVLFKRGETVKAEEIMRDLLKIGIGDNGDDGEIQMHMGDILSANGKKDEAVRFWKEALDKTKDEDVKKQLILKIEK